jgi:hypothetical protein
VIDFPPSSGGRRFSSSHSDLASITQSIDLFPKLASCSRGLQSAA